MVEGFGFGVVILASNFGSSKEIWLKLTENDGVTGDCVEAGLDGS
jgi:hypothetical protein